MAATGAPGKGGSGFGRYRLDAENGLLLRDGAPVPLPPKAFDVLRVLVGNPGRVVSKEELMATVWPDTAVEDGSLTQVVFQLRRVLGEGAVIETIPKRGYRFVTPVLVPAAEPVPKPHRRKRNWIILLVSGSVLALGGTAAYFRLTRPGRSGNVRSLAVLPLENLSHNPAEDYFADGMTEALINNLAQMGALRVVSRTSVMQYKGGRKPLPEIAHQLRVDGVVEGSVLRAGDRVRISVQLIHAPTDQHLWAKSYDRDLRDVLALQSEVAQAIAAEIRTKLTPQEQTRLPAARRVERDAYDAYLQGRYLFWNRWTQDGLTKSVEFFQQAIDKDPGYAQAYAGLAECYNTLGAFQFLPPEDAYPCAKAAATRALELDDKLAEAHSSLGVVKILYEWDLASAEREFQRAIELNPQYAQAHSLYGRCLVLRDRPDAGLAQVKRAQELDPLSLVINTDLAAAFGFAGQYDEAIAQSRKVLEMDPNSWRGYERLGWAYERKGMYKEAIVAFQKAVNVSGEPRSLTNLGCAYAAAGKRKEARKLVERLQELSKRRYVSAMHIAMIYAALGEKEAAFEWLDKAYERRENLIWLKAEGRFEKLYGDPRFTDLLRRVGLSL
jgi:TolB-like protein/DNA-binding winged helix-turn-helix (wHTH) protein/Flp pilus assembly protein TadD